MNSKDITSSPQKFNTLQSVFNILEKKVDKIFIRGKSPNGLATIKMNPMMSIKEVKIHPEALINTTNTPPEAIEYIRVFCDILEKEIEMACQNAQEKLLNKAKNVSDDINNNAS